MSRFLLACSLIATLTSSVPADAKQVAVRPTFATAVTGGFAVAPDADAPTANRIDRAAVRSKLASARAKNLARFRAYQRKGVFPSNTYLRGSLNVWIDEDGHLCAAATIIQASGHGALVRRVAEDDNFIRLGNVTSGPLLDWILTSGLTQAEIAAIQEPFMGVDGGMREPQPLVVDKSRRAEEDRRLAAKYRQVDASIAKASRSSLDAATDRLMANPSLARRFLAAG